MNVTNSGHRFRPLQVTGLQVIGPKKCTLEEAEKKYGAKIQEILHLVFKHAQFRNKQREIILSLLAGNDAFVLMPTGAGKSLCFQLPALILPGVTIVISPLIALMFYSKIKSKR
jgi:superfamily II DNA or RNA helicase